MVWARIWSVYKGLDNEMSGFWKDGQFQEIWSWLVWARIWSV